MTDSCGIEFSRPKSAVNLPANGRAFSAAASIDECSALASRFGVASIIKLGIDGELRPRMRGKQVILNARLQVELVQSCVVTLEPIGTTIDVEFERLFEFGIDDDWARFGDINRELVLGQPEIDAADPIIDDVIDIGEVAAEQLALEIEPFPRLPGAEFSPHGSPQPDIHPVNSDNPFAILNRLRNRE